MDELATLVFENKEHMDDQVYKDLLDKIAEHKKVEKKLYRIEYLKPKLILSDDDIRLCLREKTTLLQLTEEEYAEYTTKKSIPIYVIKNWDPIDTNITIVPLSFNCRFTLDNNENTVVGRDIYIDSYSIISIEPIQ
jgi:hypothetical protein